MRMLRLSDDAWQTCLADTEHGEAWRALDKIAHKTLYACLIKSEHVTLLDQRLARLPQGWTSGRDLWQQLREIAEPSTGAAMQDQNSKMVNTKYFTKRRMSCNEVEAECNRVLADWKRTSEVGLYTLLFHFK